VTLITRVGQPFDLLDDVLRLVAVRSSIFRRRSDLATGLTANDR
jgi:hypothetical protein